MDQPERFDGTAFYPGAILQVAEIVQSSAAAIELIQKFVIHGLKKSE